MTSEYNPEHRLASNYVEADAEPLPPTQTKHPWRATLRTAFAIVVGVASSWGILVQAAGLNPNWHWVAVAGLVASGVTRLLAVPQVEDGLQQYFPWLAATPRR